MLVKRPEKGNLLAVRAGQPPRVVAHGYRFNHVGASRCGRIFSADDWQPPYKIVIGSTQAERAVVIWRVQDHPDPQSEHAPAPQRHARFEVGHLQRQPHRLGSHLRRPHSGRTDGGLAGLTIAELIIQHQRWIAAGRDEVGGGLATSGRRGV